MNTPPDTWVFLRGLSREARHWGEFPETFRAAIADAAVVCVDLPGNGRHHADPSPLDVVAMVDAARAELHRAGHPPPYRLLALSLGGMVAAAWAARYPEEVAAAVLINTSLRPYGRPNQRLRPWALPTLLAILFAGGQPARREALIWQLTSAQRPADPHRLAEWITWRRDAPVSTANLLRQLIAAACYRAPVAAPAVPLLLLASAGDQLVDVGCSRQLAAAWSVPLAVHPGAGHDLPLDDGPWVARQVAAWLAGHAGATGVVPASPRA